MGKKSIAGLICKKKKSQVLEMKSKLSNGAMINEKELNKWSYENMGYMQGS